MTREELIKNINSTKELMEQYKDSTDGFYELLEDYLSDLQEELSKCN